MVKGRYVIEAMIKNCKRIVQNLFPRKNFLYIAKKNIDIKRISTAKKVENMVPANMLGSKMYLREKNLKSENG
jgi:hypothetical protein